MLSIESTIELHTLTRRMYLLAREAALKNLHENNWPTLPAFATVINSTQVVMLERLIDPGKAADYFLKCAEAANQKLVAIKKFQKQFSRDISLGYEVNGDEGDYLRANSNTLFLGAKPARDTSIEL